MARKRSAFVVDQEPLCDPLIVLYVFVVQHAFSPKARNRFLIDTDCNQAYNVKCEISQKIQIEVMPLCLLTLRICRNI
ncbi:MAG: hypothetical protein K0Q77_2830 [Anaerosporomusa subterranea]|jgi:hypothetical protein|nr:hypothetical protein [Anaerosporomusa subterranea]